jgi:hypothetical protein
MTKSPTLGRGVNSYSGEFQGQVLTVKEAGPIGLYGAPYKLSYVREATQFQSILELSMRAKGGFGGGSASASMKSFREVNFTTMSCALVAEINVYHGGNKIVGADVGAAPLKTLNNTGRTVFFDKYGDEYIDQIIYGGRLCIAFVYAASSSSEFESLEISLAGSAGNISAFADFASRIKSVNNKVQYNTFSDVIGISNKIEIRGDEDKVLEYIESFPKLVSDSLDAIDLGNPSAEKNVIDFNTSKTMDIGNFPDNVYLTSRIAESRLTELRAIYAEAITIGADLAVARQHPDRYADFSVRDLSSGRDEVDKVVRQIEGEISHIVDRPFSVGTNDYVAEKYDLKQLRKNRPLLRSWAQPIVVGKYAQRFDSNVVVKRVNDPRDSEFAGFIGLNPSGGSSWLTALALELEPDLENLRLQYKIEFIDGSVLDWSSESISPVSQSAIRGIGLRLSGSLADLYKLKFKLHFSDLGDSGPFEGSDTVITNSGKPIENLRISLRPKI